MKYIVRTVVVRQVAAINKLKGRKGREREGKSVCEREGTERERAGEERERVCE